MLKIRLIKHLLLMKVIKPGSPMTILLASWLNPIGTFLHLRNNSIMRYHLRYPVPRPNSIYPKFNFICPWGQQVKKEMIQSASCFKLSANPSFLLDLKHILSLGNDSFKIYSYTWTMVFIFCVALYTCIWNVKQKQRLEVKSSIPFSLRGSHRVLMWYIST